MSRACSFLFKGMFGIFVVFFSLISVAFANSIAKIKVENDSDNNSKVIVVEPEIKEILTLENYLEQVKNLNGNYRNYEEKMISDKAKTRESELLTALTLFANANLSQDFKAPQTSSMDYDRVDNINYNLGFSKTTDFGLNAKLYYDITKLNYIDPQPLMDDYSVSSFKIELTQSVLKNFFGKATRAQKDLIENQNLANYYTNKYNSKELLRSAEDVYWDLIIKRQTTQVKKDSVSQMQEMYDYTAKKVRMNLMDDSNAMQSKAALESGKLDLKSSIDSEKDVIRTFNSMIGIDSDILSVELATVPWDYLENYKVSHEYTPTDQVKALEQQVNMIRNNSIIEREKYKPTLDINATYSFNGQEEKMHRAARDTFAYNIPDRSIGVVFSTPLNFSAIKDFNDANYRDENAVKLMYKQQVLADRVNWNQLTDKLKYAQERLKLARQIEVIQEKKLKNEIKRWKNGVSTTYQVLQFENELTQSRLESLSIANDIFSIIANLKLFESENNN